MSRITWEKLENEGGLPLSVTYVFFLQENTEDGFEKVADIILFEKIVVADIILYDTSDSADIAPKTLLPMFEELYG